MSETLVDNLLQTDQPDTTPALPQRTRGASGIFEAINRFNPAEPMADDDAKVENTFAEAGFPSTAPVYVPRHSLDHEEARLVGRTETLRVDRVIARLTLERFARLRATRRNFEKNERFTKGPDDIEEIHRQWGMLGQRADASEQTPVALPQLEQPETRKRKLAHRLLNLVGLGSN